MMDPRKFLKRLATELGLMKNNSNAQKKAKKFPNLPILNIVFMWLWMRIRGDTLVYQCNGNK